MVCHAHEGIAPTSTGTACGVLLVAGHVVVRTYYVVLRIYSCVVVVLGAVVSGTEYLYPCLVSGIRYRVLCNSLYLVTDLLI